MRHQVASIISEPVMSSDAEIRGMPGMPGVRPWNGGTVLSPLVREVVFWVAHAAFWSLVFGATLVVVDVFRPAIAAPVPFLGIRVASCFAATAAMRWLSRHEPLLVRLGVSKIGLVAGGALSSAVVITLALAAVDRVFWPESAVPGRLGLMAMLVINFALLATWCAIYFGYELIRERNSTEFRALEAESLALKNELQHLQGQISPHFLFNALNTVVASRDDPEAIDTVTQALANYLRFLLQPSATLEPLSRELDALEQYLTVQAVRFGDGLVTRIDCDLDVRNVPVPPVMVQPLVENAIKYGGLSGERPIRVEVRAGREQGCLVVEVANMGRWAPAGGPPSTGTGLHSLERRLRLFLGPSATVTHWEADGWVRVRIRVPLGAVADEESVIQERA
jgi:sensor histidine kinase YesM